MINSTTGLFSQAVASSLLTRVMQTMRIVPQTSTIVEPGEWLSATVVPAEPQIDLSSLALGAIDGLLDLAGAATGTGLPELPGTTPPTPSGTAQSLTGLVGLPNLSVRVDVRWRLRDHLGKDLLQRDDHLTASGATSPSVTLQLPPIVRELTRDQIEDPEPGWYCLSAQVTLIVECSDGGDALAGLLNGRLGGDDASVCRGPLQPGASVNAGCEAHETGVGLASPDGVKRFHLTAELPGVPVAQLPILIPSVVICCNERNFDLTSNSAVLLVVPEGSPLTNAQAVIEALKRVEKAVRAVRTVGSVAGWMLDIGDIVSVLTDHPVVRFYVAKKAEHNGRTIEGLDRLSRIKLWPRPWYAKLFGGEKTMHDRTTSIAVIGGPGREVRFYDKTKYRIGDGAYTLETSPSPVAVINDLETPDNVGPVAQAGIVKGVEVSDEGDWNDSIDSIEFVPYSRPARRLSLSAPEGLCGPVRPVGLKDPPVDRPK